ncbi:hypothetical protein [Photobacterium kishitanii]|uniref:hypothetical protein n=1 Tax=Photobacterium kishitanii TaxID=318456 RepID=UPI0011B26EB0|nr:hypothetical protein [Photobacterium kishitanii]
MHSQNDFYFWKLLNDNIDWAEIFVSSSVTTVCISRRSITSLEGDSFFKDLIEGSFFKDRDLAFNSFMDVVIIKNKKRIEHKIFIEAFEILCEATYRYRTHSATVAEKKIKEMPTDKLTLSVVNTSESFYNDYLRLSKEKPYESYESALNELKKRHRG